MTFKKGQSGNPGGRSTEQAFSNVLRAELNQKASGDRLRLQNVVKALVAKAETGDVGAIREIADRLEGRAVQQIEAHNVNEHSFAVVGPEVTDDKWKEMLEEIRRTDAPVAAVRAKHNGNGAKSGTH